MLKQRGFTLLELVLSLAIIGLLAGLAAPRLSSIHTVVDVRGFVDNLRAAIRYAQKNSMSSECDTLVTVDASGYAVSQWPVCQPSDHQAATVVIAHPSQPEPLQASLPNQATLSGRAVFYYDRAGVPREPINGDAIARALVLSIGDHQVIIEPTTGFVHAP